MAWATPRTWGATDVATAAQLNQDVRDNFAHLKGGGNAGRPAGSWGTGLVTSTPGTPLTAQFTTEHFDATNLTGVPWTTITPPAGVYLMNAMTYCGANPVMLSVRFLRNGSTALVNPSFQSHWGNTRAPYATTTAIFKTDGAQTFGVQSLQWYTTFLDLLSQFQLVGVR